MDFTSPLCITARYRVATPLFLGSADQQTDDGQFRNASFKGALRFWWRALRWGYLLKTTAQQPVQALQKLHADEGRIFGLASDGKNSCQSAVQLQSKYEKGQTKRRGKPSALDEIAQPSICYFLGQGLYHFKEGILRPYREGGEVVVTLRFKPSTDPKDIESVRDAAIALGLFGGLGSRSRRGLGSLALQSIAYPGADSRQMMTQHFTTRQSIEQFVQRLDFSAPGEAAPFTAFTAASRIDISLVGEAGKSALHTLNRIGEEMQLYRSYGRDGKVNGQPSRYNFRDDHDNVLNAINGHPLQEMPKRGVFGLPHNYFYSSNNAKADISTKGIAGQGRRASPLFIHIHPLETGECLAIQTLLPGQFLPQGRALEIKTRKTQLINNPHADFSVITKYLDGFKKSQKLRTLREARRD